MSDLRHKPGRVALVLVFALALLAALTASVWASWGASLRSSLATMLAAGLTATPTKTARPVTPEPTGLALNLLIPTAEATTAPPAPVAVPTADLTVEPMPVDLAKIAHQYGIDASRRFIVVDVDTQRMTIWNPQAAPTQDGPDTRVRVMPVSTGDETRGYRTRPWYGLVGKYWGTFHTGEVYADEGWYLFEDSGSILIHSAPYRLVDGIKAYEDMDALGNFPASRGCIRLSPEDAQWFTEWQPRGVPLVILPRTTG